MSILTIVLGVACLYMFWNLMDIRKKNKELTIDSEKFYSELYNLKKENKELNRENRKLGRKYDNSLFELIDLKKELVDLKKELNKF